MKNMSVDTTKWKFSELKFARPDLRVYQDVFDDAIKRVEEATSGDDVLQVILELDTLTSKADDLVRFVFIKGTLDTQDPFYKEQQHWFDENMIYYDQAVLKFGEAVYNSQFRDYIEEKLGPAYFIGSDIQKKTFCNDAIPLYQRESELASEYQDIMASAQGELMGEAKSISQLKVLFGHNDREVRKAAYAAFSEAIKKNEPKLEEIWGELLDIRNQIARKLGYDNFIPIGYLQNKHIYYTPEDIEVFRKQVVEEVVPLCKKMFEAQRKRLGVDEIMAYDEKAVFPGGNARRIGDDEYMIEKARNMYHSISQETGEFIDYMLDHELFEYKDRPGKATLGYGTILLGKKAPFVFSRFDGTIADFQVVAGDLGEAFTRYTASRAQPIKEYYDASSEIMEIYALSMCLFAYDYAEDFFGEDADKYRFYNLQELITLIPIGCAVDEFQHICYANPSLTPKERTLEWRKLEEKYLPWRKYDEDDFLDRGGYWYNVPHIFLYPFYYIDYSLARVHALEMKKKYDSHPEVTWQEYMDLIKQGGRLGYSQVVEKANLTPLFQEGAVAKAISYAKEMVEEYLEKDFK